MYSKAINEEINEKDKKNVMFPSRSTLIGGGNQPKGCRFPGGQQAYKYRG